MENNTQEKFLPIGSVVLLKGGTKKAMITGFCSVSEDEPEKIYDYTGCVYPEGYLSFDEICLFDHDQIEQVYHMGYVTDEDKEFKKELIDFCNQVESGEIVLSEEEDEETDEDTTSFLPRLEQQVDENNTKADLEYL